MHSEEAKNDDMVEIPTNKRKNKNVKEMIEARRKKVAHKLL
jgi:hypothetical protein